MKDYEVFEYPYDNKINIPLKNLKSWKDTCGSNNCFLSSIQKSDIYIPYIWEYDGVKRFMDELYKKPDAVVLDIGAQQGLYSLLGKFFPESIFYAFEPFEFSYKLLEDNLKYNNVKNVIINNIGLSHKIQDNATLYVPFKGCGRGGFNTLGTNMCDKYYKLINRFKVNESDKIPIKLDTIDNLFNCNKKIDIIKIDTEGWELYILYGGLATIQKYRPIIQLEYLECNMLTANITPQDMDDFFKKIDYTYDIIKDMNGKIMDERIYYPIENKN